MENDDRILQQLQKRFLDAENDAVNAQQRALIAESRATEALKNLDAERSVVTNLTAELHRLKGLDEAQVAMMLIEDTRE